MEIEGKNGWRMELRKGSMEFGRGLGFPTADRTVSRRHVSFELLDGSDTRVRFEVIGKNPIWVLSRGSGDIRVFRSHQRGEMESGDSFCVSSKNPIWFSFKRIEFPEMDRCGFESLSISDIDPVKEFGFIVMGHEFDSYPKRMIHDMKNWNWFLEEPCKDSEDDEVCEKKRGTRGKRKLAGDNDDDWMGESDEDKERVAKVRKNQRLRYSTRSKDYNKTRKDAESSKNSMKANGDDHEYEDEDNDETEDEDTLGGFIVNDNEEEEEEESDKEEEEEEEDFDEELDE